MRIHPDIAALRSNPASQRRAQSAIEGAVGDWRTDESVRAIASELERYAKGAPFDECDHLRALLTDREHAVRFVDTWRDTVLAGLTHEPLAEVPFRHKCSASLTTLQLMNAGPASLSLVAYDELDQPSEPTAAVFSDRELYEIIVHGSARGLVHHLSVVSGARADIVSRPRRWEAGDCSAIEGLKQARHFVEVSGSMTVLQLARTARRPQHSCSYALDDGRLLQRASGDKRASQDFIALDVLGALDRDDALPAMRELALGRDRDADLRWEAVRQTLGLDAASGIALLDELAECPGDPLAVPARSLKRTLCEDRVEDAVAIEERVQCPA